MTETALGNSGINFRESWRVEKTDKVPEFEEDGSIFIGDGIGFLRLPQDYKDFMTSYPGGITPTTEDSFILARFQEESFEVQLDYLISLEDLVSQYSSGYESAYEGGSKSRLPAKHVIIGSGSIDDFILNVDPETANFGQVFNWTRAGDPWGAGDNTEGLGWVANSFTDLMSNLAEESDNE